MQLLRHRWQVMSGVHQQRHVVQPHAEAQGADHQLAASNVRAQFPGLHQHTDSLLDSSVLVSPLSDPVGVGDPSTVRALDCPTDRPTEGHG